MKSIRILLIAIPLLLLLSQTQPLIVHALRGVDGSFGLRPRTHECIGQDIWLGE